MIYNLDDALSDIKELNSNFEDVARAARKLPPINTESECLIAVYIRNLQDKVDRYKKIAEKASKLPYECLSSEFKNLILDAHKALKD